MFLNTLYCPYNALSSTQTPVDRRQMRQMLMREYIDEHEQFQSINHYIESFFENKTTHAKCLQLTCYSLLVRITALHISRFALCQCVGNIANWHFASTQKNVTVEMSSAHCINIHNKHRSNHFESKCRYCVCFSISFPVWISTLWIGACNRRSSAISSITRSRDDLAQL